MPLISGIFNEPDGRSAGGVMLRFTLIENTRHSFYARISEVVTGEDGSYSIELSPGQYIVKCLYRYSSDQLGTILVQEGTTGSLNDYLLTSGPFSPTIVSVVQEMYDDMVGMLASPVQIIATEQDIPGDPAGLFLVQSDNTKGGGAQMYFYQQGRRFWFAGVED